MADIGDAAGLVFPPLSEAQTRALRAVLGPKVALANPLDYHTYIWGDRARMAQTFGAMLEGDVALGIVILDFPRADRCPSPEWEVVVQAAADAQRAVSKPLAILSSLAETMPEIEADRIAARGLIPLSGLDEALAAVVAAADLGRVAASVAPILQPREVVAPVLLSEAEAKERLAGHGVPVPRSATVSSVDAAAAAADRIGYPVVLKGLGIAHKTEAGAVRLGLQSAEALRTAAAAMPTSAFLVEEMVVGGLAEVLVGVVSDPAHGQVLTLAAGGVLTEVLADRVSLLVPASASDVAAALDSLRMAPVLAGWRGAPPVAKEALVAAVMAVQDFVEAHHGRVAEVEINPLICTATTVIAADALVRMGDPDD